MRADEPAEEVGSVGEEAAKLFEAFTEVLAAGRAEQPAGPGDPTPEDGAPEDGAPGDGAPGDGAPEDGAPGDGAPGDGAPEDAAARARWSGEGLAALAADAVSALRDADLHVATGGEDCRVCPVCRAIHTARETTPEVRSHLVTAARSLLAAGSALIDHLDQLDHPADPTDTTDPTDPTESSESSDSSRRAAPPRPGRARRPSGPGVERIDLDQHDDEHDDRHGAPESQEEHP